MLMSRTNMCGPKFPAAIHANITARRFGKWNGGADHEPGIPLMCSQKFVASDV
jgi:hypothetical protein